MPFSVTNADLRGVARLGADATLGVSHVVEGVHQAVWQTLGVPARPGQPVRTRGLTGVVYAAVRGVTRLVGASVDVGLACLPEAVPSPGTPGGAEYDTWRAVLNGVLGDHLVATANPLALSMALRYAGQTLVEMTPGAPPEPTGCIQSADGRDIPLAVPDATGRVALLVHGLCMDDSAWARGPADAPTHIETLAALGYTPVSVHYNTGLPLVENGRRLATLLDALYARWPVPVTDLVIVTHSMGGLVARLAVHRAEARSSTAGMPTGGGSWRSKLTRLVFLGTPHHGAPLERAGSWVDAALALTRFSAPFGMLGAIRSAGITDLRHGQVAGGADLPPLPPGVACYAVAATLADQRTALADHLTGDGLVPVRSALGAHADADRTLAFAAERCHVTYQTGHLALLHAPAVTRQVAAWLGDEAEATAYQARSQT